MPFLSQASLFEVGGVWALIINLMQPRELRELALLHSCLLWDVIQGPWGVGRVSRQAASSTPTPLQPGVVSRDSSHVR